MVPRNSPTKHMTAHFTCFFCTAAWRPGAPPPAPRELGYAPNARPCALEFDPTLAQSDRKRRAVIYALYNN